MVDSLAPKRDIGIMADYAIGGRATISAGVFNGEGQNITANADSSVLWVGRATARPVAYLTVGANVAQYEGDLIFVVNVGVCRDAIGEGQLRDIRRPASLTSRAWWRGCLRGK